MAYNFSSVVLIFLFFEVSSYAIPAGDVNTICKQIKNPSFCVNLLNSKPGADFLTLTQYTIDVARANISNTINLINKLISQSASNPKAQSHYKSCLIHFGSNGGALGDVEQTQVLLKRGDYRGVVVSASKILTDVDNCIYGQSPDLPFPDPSMLPSYASVVVLVVQIILILPQYLGH